MARNTVKHRIGHKVAHLAFHCAAYRTVAFDSGVGFSHNAGFHFLDRASQLGNACLDRFVLGNGCIQQDGVASGRGHVACVIERQGQVTNIFRVGISLNNRNTANHGWIGHCAIFSVREFGVRVTANNSVQTRNRSGDFHVLVHTNVVQRDDLGHAHVGQCVNVMLQVLNLVREDNRIRWAGGFNGIYRQSRNDTDLFAANL